VLAFANKFPVLAIDGDSKQTCGAQGRQKVISKTLQSILLILFRLLFFYYSFMIISLCS